MLRARKHRLCIRYTRDPLTKRAYSAPLAADSLLKRRQNKYTQQALDVIITKPYARSGAKNTYLFGAKQTAELI